VLCRVQRYASLHQLVEQNADFIVDAACRNIRSIELNPETPNLLRGVISLSGVSLLSIFEDTLDTALKTLDKHIARPLPFIQLFQSVLLALGNAYQPPHSNYDEMLKEYHQFAKRIVLKARHFVFARELNVRCAALDALKLGLEWLSAAEEIPIQPIVYDMWGILISVLREDEPMLQRACSELITRLIELIPEFLLGKIDDIWNSAKPIVAAPVLGRVPDNSRMALQRAHLYRFEAKRTPQRFSHDAQLKCSVLALLARLGACAPTARMTQLVPVILDETEHLRRSANSEIATSAQQLEAALGKSANELFT
jgi:hypothetical protein